jgi:replicative DNA helicase
MASADRPEFDSYKVPPHSIDAEQSVLGALLIDNSALDKIADVVGEADFYNEAHRLIFQHINLLASEAKPSDIITVSESLKSVDKLSYIGGLPYLGSLADSVPTTAHVRRYAEIVRENAVLRQLASVAAEIAESAYRPLGRNAEQLLDEAEGKVFQIAESGDRTRAGFQSVEHLLPALVDQIEKLANRDDPSNVTGIRSGYSDLDEMTAGLQRGDLIIVAGRQSMGKTAFALNIAEHVALDSKLPVAVFSMEMGAQQLAMRMLASVGRLDAHKLRVGKLSGTDWEKFSEAIGKLDKAKIFIDETAGVNPYEMRARARRLHRQHGGLGAIVIDYIQLMSSSSSGSEENRATELAAISRSLKSLAKELQVPVIALSQLNRSLEQRPNKRPVMSDLRESGAIEQDADLILFIYRDEVYDPNSAEKGTAEIIIAKQRNGPIGTVKLTFLGQFTRFENHTGGYTTGAAPVYSPYGQNASAPF